MPKVEDGHFLRPEVGDRQTEICLEYATWWWFTRFPESPIPQVVPGKHVAA